MPESVNVHLIMKESDCPKLEVLQGAEFVGADAEWKAEVASAFGSGGGSKGPALL